MAVQLEAGVFHLSDGPTSFTPSAAEIYEIIFQGTPSVRGVTVSCAEFQTFGLSFSEYIADPVIVIEAEATPDGLQILCHFRAQSGGIEGDVASVSGAILDYAIGGGQWMPLPSGAVAEAKEILRSLDRDIFGRVNLGQYLRLLRLRPEGITVEDRTANALAAPNLALSTHRDAPEGFVGNLYPYQLTGFGWLSLMTHNALGGIIADEMGLGKTIQVICLLLEAKSNTQVPNLVIAPTTVMENWRRELSRFAPSLNVLIHHGARRTGYPTELLSHDVVISSFETSVTDVSLLRNIHWNLVIVDEAQNIKNPHAKRTVQLKTIPRECAIAVTGTPVENRLQDLWSITDFILPSLLGSLDQFERRHPDTVSSASQLEPVVSPLILRRTIEEVAGDLPERIDISQPLHMDENSAAIYEFVRAEVASQSSASGGFGVLQKLRMFCTHPWLTNHLTQVVDAADCSVKLQRLFEIIDEIASSNGKALIFTSYTGAIDLIRVEVRSRFGIFTDIIDGRVPIADRQKKVDEFAAHKSSAVLVLNPKAAGVGLNIAAANHVIHFNLEWNPAVEDQASARAHRRGQTRTVTVHRLFYLNTVEEVIDDRMRHKREIATAAVVGTEGATHEVDDIIRALRISPLTENINE